MNISYNWLKDLIEIDLAPELLAEKLTRVGLAVEGVHPHGDDYVFDIDLTSNRPDCLSHLGVSREIAVITGAETRPVGSVSASTIDSAPNSKLVTVEEHGALSTLHGKSDQKRKDRAFPRLVGSAA